MNDPSTPVLTGIAVNWHDETGVERLAAGWPDDPRFELVIVNNGSNRGLDALRARILEPGRNLGFAGAVNLGIRSSHSELVLILNSDIFVEPGALEGLLDGFQQNPETGGLAPQLLDEAGNSQHRWQLRRLPSGWTLVLQSLLLPAGNGSSTQPEAGSFIEQPAGAALALRRQVLDEMAGLDERFYPAWFEDVDLAARLQAAGHKIRYWPASKLRHRMGATIPTLGYRRFLWIYYANLGLYLEKHHGKRWAIMARCLLVPACLWRILFLPIRKPRRAKSRRMAARGLVGLMQGALSGWRWPSRYSAAANAVGRVEGDAE